MTHNKWCLIYGSLVFSRSSTPRFYHESYIISIRWGLDAEEIKALHARLVGRERELDGSWRESSSDDWLYIDMIICHICVGLIRSGECGITQVVVSWRLAPSIEIIQVLQRTNAKKNMIDQMYHIFCDVLFLHAGKVAGPLSQSILSQIKGIHVTTWIHLASTGPDPSSSMFWSLCDVFAMVILCSVAGIRKSSLIRSCHLVPAFGRLRNREWLGDSKSTS